MTGKSIGKVLRTQREAKRMTEGDSAKWAKVARSYLARLEAGHSNNVSVAVLQAPRQGPRRARLGAPRVTRRPVIRKPLQRAANGRPPERVTTNQIMAWLNERLAQDPKLRRRINQVLTALQKMEAPALARRGEEVGGV